MNGVAAFFLWPMALLATLSLVAGIAKAAKQIAFLAHAYRVQGTVADEWRYRMYGQNKRYYRVAFRLQNGQLAELRSAVASLRGQPHIGQAVPVLVRERASHGPKAQIGVWSELWFPSVLLLFLSATAAFGVAILSRSALV